MDSQKMGRDWHHLPPELLEFIRKKVTSLADYIRFRAVCRPWQNACCLGCPDHLPLQLPWLMLPYQIDGTDDSSSTRLFYDLAASKIRKLDLPETRGVSICGSSHGWFVLQKGQVVSLLNPITRATISLPLFTGTPSHIGIAPPHSENFFENTEAERYSINPTDNVIVRKAILTSSPQDPSCIIFVLSASKWRLAFCKIGDKRWTVIEFSFVFGWDIWDITYANGFLYTVNCFSAVTMYNLTNHSRTLLIGDGHLIATHLVEGVSGDILLIHDRTIYVNGILIETEHKVYKLSNDEEPEWIKVIDVGQNVLFLGGGPNALSLSSANLQFPEWGINCLCYDSVRTEKWNPQDSCYSWYNHNIKLARLDDGTVTDITRDLGSFQKNTLWQRSLWLTPSLL